MLKILVISDFHAYSRPLTKRSKKPDPSYFILQNPTGKDDVASGFLQHLEKQKTEADVVVCCGDLVDKTDTGALDGAWNFAHKVQRMVNARHLLICTGNHDVDSHAITGAQSPFEKLKMLIPLYPSPIQEEYNAYWANNYFIKEEITSRYVILNSCSSHGYNRGEDCGIFANDTARVFDTLRGLPAKPINICVCHHHPHRHGEHGLGEHDDMKNSQVLIDGFSRYDLGCWLVIHGHKHHAKLSYAQGNSFSPIVFSSGSLSARLYERLAGHARNQYHLVTIDNTDIVKYKRLVGRYQSWSWFPMIGWRDAEESDGLPAQGGFGYRDITTLTENILGYLKQGRTPWTQVISEFEAIQFLIPDDFQYFLQIIESNGVQLERDESLGKKTIRNLIR